jgi:uncharacterized protein DUF2380
MPFPYPARLALSLCLALITALPAFAQAGGSSAHSESLRPRAAPDARVVLLPVALYNAQANLQERSDSSKAALATRIMTDNLQALLGRQLVASDSVALVDSTPEARATTGKQPCNVIVACARLVGKRLGAPWVVMAKVSKTSNLIWLFTGQLIHVPSGEIVLDDSTELKGEPDAMVRAGSRIFAERVARTVRRGGLASNFPKRAP